MTDATLAAAPPLRVAWIDRARGALLVAMIVYHFSFDLQLFGLVGWNVSAGGWRAFAICIAGGFIALSGLSLGIAYGGGIRWRSFLRRLGILVLAAAAVTVGSRAAMGTAITFGILHAIALFSVLALPFLRAPVPVVAVIAVTVLVLPFVWQSEAFSHPALYPLGLDPTPGPYLDYEPVFPWFAAMLVGLILARIVPLPRRAAAMDPLARMGRHSLVVYLLHQPIMIGLFYAARSLGVI